MNMNVKSMYITSSGDELGSIDLLSEKIIVFGVEQAEGITYDGTFALKEQITIIDEYDNEITTQQWEEMVGEAITYNDETLQIIPSDHPKLEESIKAILSNSVKNEELMKSGGIN